MCITPVGGTSRRKREQILKVLHDKIIIFGVKCKYNFNESSLKVARKQNLAWAVYVAHVLNILDESDG